MNSSDRPWYATFPHQQVVGEYQHCHVLVLDPSAPWEAASTAMHMGGWKSQGGSELPRASDDYLMLGLGTLLDFSSTCDESNFHDGQVLKLPVLRLESHLSFLLPSKEFEATTRCDYRAKTRLTLSVVVSSMPMMDIACREP